MSLQLSPSPLSRSKTRNVRRRVPFYRKRWVAILTIFVLLSGVTCLAIVLAIIKPLREKAEALQLDNIRKIESASHIHDRNGDELGRIYVMNRTPIKIEQVPMHFIHALTAEEDARFYEHNGVDWIGVCRAIWLNFKAGGETQGASTITQQLAREAFKLKEELEGDGDKHSRYKRKIVEAFLAQRIEKQYSKSDILEMYLNRVYFGGGAYGVEAAAQNYFGKDISQITIEESASLCCVLKNPGGLNPRLHPKEHKRWRDHVLDRMVDERFLTSAECEELKAKPLVVTQRIPDARLSYVYDEIRQQAIKIIGEEESTIGGFHIYTSIDSHLQKVAEESVRKRLTEVENFPGYPHPTFAQYRASIDSYRKKMAAKEIDPETPRPQAEYLQGAMLAIDNRDGSILAMVGGRDFVDSMYNRALQSRRPAGTAFIPFVYATAFQKPNFYPPMQLEDGPLDNRRVMIDSYTGFLGEWGTEQEETKYSDHISAREALVTGRNGSTIRLAEQVGLEPVKQLAARAGITSPLRDAPSTFLGSSEVRMDEMCLAYSSFPNMGRRAKEVSIIRRITDSDGKVIYQVKENDDQMVEVMDDVAAYQTHSCLTDALTRGTGKVAYEEYGLGKFPAAGKTGTHSGFKDLWFMGYTSSITCGVWCGFDQQKTIFTGAVSKRIALPIWVDVMNAAQKDYQAEVIPPPQDAQSVEVCRKSGLRATDGCYEKVPDLVHGGTKMVRDTYWETLRHRSYFDTYCNIHGSGGAPLAIMNPLETQSSTPEAPEVANAEPVHMKSPTVLGNDPYFAILPPLHAIPVNEDGSAVKKAIPVSAAEDDGQKAARPAIKLQPPPKLNLDN